MSAKQPKLPTGRPPLDAAAGGSSPLTANPFAKLEAMREKLPSKEGPTPAVIVRTPKGPARAVVRYEKKGRGGKLVTAIEKLGLPPAELERWCSELKRELGCGGVVEDDAIILQGDLRPRLHAILTRRGVGNVVGTDVQK